MTDATTPDIDDVTPDDETAPLDVEEIVTEAKKNFRLSDRLQGIKLSSKKVPIFLDMDAVERYSELNAHVQALVDAAGQIPMQKPEPTGDAANDALALQLFEQGLARHKALMTKHDELESQLEEAKRDMYANCLVIHLRAYPNVAVKVARKHSRKAFFDEELGRVPEDPETLERAQEHMDLYLLGQSIVKIVDSSGAEDTLAKYQIEVKDKDTGKTKKVWVNPRETIGQELSEQLPPSQWTRLHNVFIRLTMTDQIGKAATDDPGF